MEKGFTGLGQCITVFSVSDLMYASFIALHVPF